MIKKINALGVQLALDMALMKAGKELEKGFNRWPEDSDDGVEVKWEDVKVRYDRLVAELKDNIDSLLGGSMPINEHVEVGVPEPLPEYDVVNYHPYQKLHYKDGRGRYLFRCTMDDLQGRVKVLYKGNAVIETDIEGMRWENADGALLKNSHGRENSVTLLLPSFIPLGEVELRVRRRVWR